mmetsp:Transcript_23921/g.75212  ORF Transcript_23921/g.75212 Transcript_23921/m.75212 type:complete len:211 (+) Transcript_23921:417-1049(+)
MAWRPVGRSRSGLPWAPGSAAVSNSGAVMPCFRCVGPAMARPRLAARGPGPVRGAPWSAPAQSWPQPTPGRAPGQARPRPTRRRPSSSRRRSSGRSEARCWPWCGRPASRCSSPPRPCGPTATSWSPRCSRTAWPWSTRARSSARTAKSCARPCRSTAWRFGTPPRTSSGTLACWPWPAGAREAGGPPPRRAAARPSRGALVELRPGRGG